MKEFDEFDGGGDVIPPYFPACKNGNRCSVCGIWESDPWGEGWKFDTINGIIYCNECNKELLDKNENISKSDDPINHPSRYTSHPSGVECITITEYFNFNIGNAIKYLWMAGLKGGTSRLEDLKKAAWHVQREIQLAEKMKINPFEGCECSSCCAITNNSEDKLISSFGWTRVGKKLFCPACSKRNTSEKHQ